MAPPLLTLQDIHLTFGGNPLLTGASMTVAAGERLCLVGRNGCGKSTFLKIAAGEIEADSGRRFVQPGTAIRYLPQEPDLSAFETIDDYIRAGLSPADDGYRGAYLLEALGVDGSAGTTHLSGGEARRAALAATLISEPDILLLDEPTNHLDLATIEWLESELAASRSALVLISHDRRFLESLSRATLWLDRGEARLLGKGFGRFEAWRDEVLEQEALDQHKLDRKLAAEAHWLRYGVTARRKRNQGRLRKLQDLRAQRRDHVGPKGRVKLSVQDGQMSGKLVFDATAISKAFGDRRIVRDLDLRVLRGDRLALVGPNGSGKTTLLKLLTGETEADSGEVKRGAAIDMVTLDQRREALKSDWTLADALTGGGGDQVMVNGSPRHVMGYMKDFLFDPVQARTPISRLSGGERGRLMLARAFAKPSNLLILDEPTNDLDLETLDLLEELLDDYTGTVLLVSHDRDFLDRVATSVLAVGEGGRWTEYAGGYSDMLHQLGETAAASASVQAKEKAKPKLEPKSDAGTTPKPKQKSGLSFTEQHELDKLPAEMEALEAKIAKLQEKLGEPGLYEKDRAAFDKASAQVAGAMEQLSVKEERWLELEDKAAS
ncbi:MAG: ABC-F family ATP-binding cassette domain-containing protein [Magnetovibrionaceae bacterium]